jgi:hypothetical protein
MFTPGVNKTLTSKVGKFDTSNASGFGVNRDGGLSLPPHTAPQLTKYAGGKFFGGAGGSAAINMGKPFVIQRK